MCGRVPFDLVEKPVGTLDLLLHLLRHGTSNVEAILAGTGMNRDTYQRAKARLLSLGFAYEEQQADNLAYRYLGLTAAGEAFARAIAPAGDLLAATAAALEAELAHLEAADEPATVRRRLDLLEIVADREFALGRWDSAADRATRLTGLGHGSGDRRREASGRLLLGKVLQKRDRHEEAVKVLEGAFELADAAGADDLAGEAEYLIGSALERQGRWDAAAERYASAGRRAERTQDAVRRALARQGSARILARQGRLEESLDLLRDAIRDLESVRAEDELPRAYVSLGSAAYLMGRPEAADWFDKAIATARRLADPRIEALALSSAAAHGIDRRDFRTADAYLRRARTLFEDLGERSGLGGATLNTANLLAAQDRWAEAEAQFADALGLARETGDRFLEASVRFNEGQMNKRRDHRNEAIALLTEARRLFTELGSAQRAARCEDELRDLTGPGTR